MSIYVPRERKGPGEYMSDVEAAAWWAKNKDKFWNPAMGLYDDESILMEAQENITETLDEVPTDLQTCINREVVPGLVTSTVKIPDPLIPSPVTISAVSP